MSLIPPGGSTFRGHVCVSDTEDEEVEITVDQTVTRLLREIRNVKELSAIYGISDEPDAQLSPSSVVSVTALGGADDRELHDVPWRLSPTEAFMVGSDVAGWSEIQKICFYFTDLERLSDATLLNSKQP